MPHGGCDVKAVVVARTYGQMLSTLLFLACSFPYSLSYTEIRSVEEECFMFVLLILKAPEMEHCASVHQRIV